MSLKKLCTVLLASLILCVAASAMAAEKTVIVPAKAPKAVGPYSQGIMANGLIFTSGQLPLDPATNTMP